MRQSHPDLSMSACETSASDAEAHPSTAVEARAGGAPRRDASGTELGRARRFVEIRAIG